MKKHNSNTSLTTRSKARRYMAVWTALVLSLCLFTVPASAAGGDPLDIVNNLSDFIFSIIKALGVIILGWGIVQVGMSIQSHDASQRTQGFLCLFGGLMIAFAKEILTAIWRGISGPINPNTGEMRLTVRRISPNERGDF